MLLDQRVRVLEGVALAVVLLVLLAWPLCTPPIGHHGEAREGLVVQDIVANGHWILPRRNGDLPSKPPLFHWAAALATLVFGGSDASLRLPSAVAAVVVALTTYALGVWIGGRQMGWLASGIVIGMAPFLSSAVEARVDMVFAAAVTVALAGFYLWDTRRNGWGRRLCYAGVAAAVLAKGPAGAVIPALVIAVFLVVDGRPAALRALWHTPLVLVVVIVAGGWYGLAAVNGGREFLHLQLVHENFERVVGGAAFHHGRHHHAARLPLALLGGFLPWSLAILWAGVARLRGTQLDAAGRFLHVWWFVILVLFSAAAGQRPVYLLPAAPAVALLAARLISELLADDDGATSGVARLTPPARLRRAFPDRPRLALLAVAIATLDLGVLLVLQTTRIQRAGKGSLAAFGETVRQNVPSDTPLLAADTLGKQETLILAYRSARTIPRASATRPPVAYYLVPAAESAARVRAGATLVAESDRHRGPNVALLRAGS